MARDLIEVLLAVAVGGTLWAAIGRVRRGEARPRPCAGCGRPSSRAYPGCTGCGHPR